MAARETYLPTLASLFQESDLKQPGIYSCSASEMRERLQLLGLSRTWVDKRVRQIAQRMVEETDEQAGEHETTEALIESLGKTIENEMIRRIEDISDDEELDHDPLFNAVVWENPQLGAAMLVHRTGDGSTEVAYNLTDLVERGYLASDRPITNIARADYDLNASRSSRLIVLTEGSSDAWVLREAIAAAYPHLSEFLSFMDFSTDAPGGAAALVKQVQVLNGAGVANRVVAIADNDTAAHEALAKLKEVPLPDNFRILHYPSLPSLTDYPVRGPAGVITMDINGMGGALEMYLGSELLLGADGRRIPIQLTGWSAKLDRYQGSLLASDKKQVLEKFKAKLKAGPGGSADPADDWSGIKAIVNSIVAAFD